MQLFNKEPDKLIKAYYQLILNSMVTVGEIGIYSVDENTWAFNLATIIVYAIN